MILKYDFPNETQSTHALGRALQGLESLVGSKLDMMVLTSKDPFLSEYVPLENNPRYGATLFTGSVGDAIYFTAEYRKSRPGLKPVVLFVDGRYHLQADQEVDTSLVEVVKLDVEPNIEKGVQTQLQAHLTSTPHLLVGLDFERTSIASLSRFKNLIENAKGSLISVTGTEVLSALGLAGWNTDRTIQSVSTSLTGRPISKTLAQLRADLKERSGSPGNLHITATTDDAAFLLNARGYHLPYASSVLAYTFCFQDELVVFLPFCSREAKVNIESSQLGSVQLTVIRDALSELKQKLQSFSITDVYFNGAAMNGLLPTLVTEIAPLAKIHSDCDWIVKSRMQKTPEEMEAIRDSFLRSSRAIAKTLRFGKQTSAERKFSEVELKNKLAEEFAKEGALAHSFKTISGAGPHSAIVHYSTPSHESFFEPGELALLDCGAYYEPGFATDTTRGFFVRARNENQKPLAWQTEIYTATLKSAIQVFLKPVDSRLTGVQVDALMRDQVKAAGYDYMHGTGHGVGIHVHEDGIRFSTLSVYGQTAFACVSVEPGIYLKDKGGVRIENIVLLQPEGTNQFRYENLVFVGYDWDLIDVSKLSAEEKSYLSGYEAICKKLGTELTECPL